MENLILAPLDIALLLVLLVGAWRGFVKGLVLSVASLLGLVGGIWAQVTFHMWWRTPSLSMSIGPSTPSMWRRWP